jgi:ParB-like chromosome segregation protein Spo0J
MVNTGLRGKMNDNVPLRLGEETSTQVTRVPIGALRSADSPRLNGESLEHALTLANTEAELPPIIVHEPTMRVIDGMHRLKAAELRGQHEIDVLFFTGSGEDAFVLAVEANISHGLPLSTADREAAVIRMIAAYPDRSNRAIAISAGVSAKTVAAIRARSTHPDARTDARVGRDGRLRPVDATKGRRRAHEVIKARPDATLREIAREAGVAVATARDVRARVRRGEDPVPARFCRSDTTAGTPEPVEAGTPGREAVLDPVVEKRDLVTAMLHLTKDPSLRFSDQGRNLLRWLGVHVVSFNDSKSVLESVPSHCTNVVADLAWKCAEAWRELAQRLEGRARSDAVVPLDDGGPAEHPGVSGLLVRRNTG